MTDTIMIAPAPQDNPAPYPVRATVWRPCGCVEALPYPTVAQAMEEAETLRRTPCDNAPHPLKASHFIAPLRWGCGCLQAPGTFTDRMHFEREQEMLSGHICPACMDAAELARRRALREQMCEGLPSAREAVTL